MNIAYLRGSKDEQENTLVSQRNLIEERQLPGKPVERWIVDQGASAKDTRRDGLQEALSLLEAGDILYVAESDRLTRRVHDWCHLDEAATKGGWDIYLLDMPVDTRSPAGRAFVIMRFAWAEWEWYENSQRTKNALTVVRARGVTLGRPRTIPDEVRREVIRLHGEQLSLAQIAEKVGRTKDSVRSIVRAG